MASNIHALHRFVRTSGTISAPWKVPSGNAGAMDPLKGTSIDSRRSDGRWYGRAGVELLRARTLPFVGVNPVTQ